MKRRLYPALLSIVLILGLCSQALAAPNAAAAAPGKPAAPAATAAAPAAPAVVTPAVAAPAATPAGPVTAKVDAILAASATETDNAPLSLFAEKTNFDGTMIRVPLERNEVDGATAIITAITPSLNGVQAFVSSQLGVPMLIISGTDPSAVESARERIIFAIGKNTQMPKMLVEISASLKEYTENELKNLGIPLIPTSFSGFSGALGYNTGSTPPLSLDVEGTLSYPDVSIYNNNNVGKVLVGSNVVTGNGIMCNLSSTDTTPILISQNGSVTTSNQNIVTTVQVTPTILSYDEKSLTNSLVKLDVQVQLSVPTGTVTMDNTSANSYTQKNLQTVRVLPANGAPILAGSFISDMDQKLRMYIPILGQIPLIKYFFSYETTQRQRQISILMLSVRLMPEDSVRLGVNTKAIISAAGGAD